LWAAYGFRYEAMVDAQAGRDRFYSLGAVPEGKTVWEYQLRKLDHYKPVIGWLREHRVFPEAYIYSAAFSAQTARGRNSFLNGHISIHGHRWFFPYTFLAKTPLPLFGLLAVSGSAAFFARRQSDSPAPKKSPPAPNEPHPAMSFLYRTSPLWVFFGVYWAASLQSHLNIGHRHVMPTYPVLFVLCGASACYLRARSNALRLVVPVLVLLFAACSVYIYPHYLTYFNSIAGGPDKGYRHLVDSSLDWGQDLPGLRKYLDARRAEGFAGDVYVSYFGSGSTLALSHFGVEARTLRLKLSDDATGQYAYTPGLYAISATNLHQIYSTVGRNTPLHTWTDKLDDLYDEHRAAVQPFLASPDTKGARAPFANKRFQKVFNRFERLRLARLCAYLRHREPDHVVNHTILVFDLDQDELHKALIEPISESGLIPFVNPAAPG